MINRPTNILGIGINRQRVGIAVFRNDELVGAGDQWCLDRGARHLVTIVVVTLFCVRMSIGAGLDS